MSQSTGSVCTLPKGMDDDTGSVGIMQPNVTFRLVDDDENDVPEGESGELWVKGPAVALGYYNNEQATKGAFVDGWYRTVDVLQNRGRLWYVTDRKKELIEYKVIQVAPAEIEGLLLSHSLIEDAAVIGVPDDGTEVPRGYVQADRNKISEDKIKDFVKSKLASYKQLRGGVVYIDQILRSAVGKILRKDLAKRETRARLSYTSDTTQDTYATAEPHPSHPSSTYQTTPLFTCWISSSPTHFLELTPYLTRYTSSSLPFNLRFHYRHLIMRILLHPHLPPRLPPRLVSPRLDLVAPRPPTRLRLSRNRVVPRPLVRRSEGLIRD